MSSTYEHLQVLCPWPLPPFNRQPITLPDICLPIKTLTYMVPYLMSLSLFAPSHDVKHCVIPAGRVLWIRLLMALIGWDRATVLMACVMHREGRGHENADAAKVTSAVVKYSCGSTFTSSSYIFFFPCAHSWWSLFPRRTSCNVASYPPRRPPTLF